MKVLVFGATGQVALELQKYAGVCALNRAFADLSDPAACARIIAATDADVVINAAAYTAVDAAEADEVLAMTINAEAPAQMAKSAAERGIPFLHVSTDYVFGGDGTEALEVDTPTGPINAYGRSKLAGEIGVRQAGGNHAILRTSWVFSAHGGNFVKTMLKLGGTRDALNIVNDQIGGPTAASDIAACLMEMAAKMVAGQKGGTYHFSGGPDVSWAEFAREIFSQANLPVQVTGIPTAQYPTPAQRPLNSRLDCTALNADFGIDRPNWKVSLAQVLRDLDWT